MSSTLTSDQLERLAGILQGTCKSIHAGLESMDLDGDAFDDKEVEDALLDYQLEACTGCGWWMEPCDLVNGDGDVVGCSDCRKSEDE